MPIYCIKGVLKYGIFEAIYNGQNTFYSVKLPKFRFFMAAFSWFWFSVH